MKKFSDKNIVKHSAVRKSRSASKRTLIKPNGTIPSKAEKGLVLASIGKFIIVRELMTKQIYECYLGGTLITPNRKSSLIAVGDNVHFIVDAYENESTVFDETISESGYKTGVIIAVDERRNTLARKVPGKTKREQILAANADYLLLIMSAIQPQYNRRLIDRFLVAAELGGLKFALCVNKMDLIYSDDHQYLKDDFLPYQKIGIELFFVSVENEIGLEEVDDFLEGKRVILSGPSGVGKSSLVNYLVGDSIQDVNEISERTQKGQHTTSSVRMFDLDDETQLIDTPGIREFAIAGLDKEELSLYFHEFDPFFPDCKYPQCTHIHEPNCAVTDAVENDLIDADRYESYVNMYTSFEEMED